MRPWIIVGSTSALLFALLAVTFLQAPYVLDAIDAYLASFTESFQTFQSIEVLLVITALGGAVGIIAVAIGFSYLARLSTANLYRLIFLLSIVAFANRILKVFFARVRPEELLWFDPLPSFSFPSAHASAILALYGFMAVMLWRSSHRVSAVVLPVAVIFLVGFSRIVLHAHYFTDVLAGYLLGLSLLAFAIGLPFEKLNAFSKK